MHGLRSGLFAVVVASQSACATDATQLLIEVSADEDVKSSLERIKVFAYPAEANDSAKPLYQQLFSLKTGPATTNVHSLPLSFGVGRGSSETVKLVVAGYTSAAADAQPVIEHKLLATFENERSVPVSVKLSSACYMRALACAELDETCTGVASDNASPGDCVPVVQARQTVASGVADAGTPPLDPSPDVAACPSDNTCNAAEYPCVGSTGAGYSCQGHVAEWPMPDSQPGAKFKPAYDVTTIPGVVRDTVTGLLWQRELPTRYAGCVNETGCTVAEARAYCEQLSLAGVSWRLPSKVELESLLDTTQPRVRVDLAAFPATSNSEFWTASVVRSDYQHSWTVNFGNTFSFASPDDELNRVRCVRSVVTRNGTPEDRFALNGETATDRHTTLEWQRLGVAAETSQAATEVCEAMGDRWRVPTMKELLTLVDPLEGGPALPPGVFEKHGVEAIPLLNWASHAVRGTLGGMVPVMSVGLGSTWVPLPASENTGGTEFVYQVRCVR